MSIEATFLGRHSQTDGSDALYSVVVSKQNFELQFLECVSVCVRVCGRQCWLDL